MAALRGIAMAPAAARWLATTRAARVLNIFDRACNLTNQDDAVLAMVTSERGLTPFALVVAGDERTPFRALPVESPVRLDQAQSCLFLGPLLIEYGAAALWDAQPDWPALRRLFLNDRTLEQRLAAIVAEAGFEGSLLDLYRPAPSGSILARPLLQRAQSGASDLVHGLARQQLELAVRGAHFLAGLGGGLTPAGDDFMVGALLAAWAGLYGAGAESLGPEIVAAAAPRTTTLSAAYLRAAAHGECMAHWHTLFWALQCADKPATRAAVQSLMSIGHTSGADALAGFLAVHYVFGRTPQHSPDMASRRSR